MTWQQHPSSRTAESGVVVPAERGKAQLHSETTVGFCPSGPSPCQNPMPGVSFIRAYSDMAGMLKAATKVKQELTWIASVRSKFLSSSLDAEEWLNTCQKKKTHVVNVVHAVVNLAKGRGGTLASPNGGLLLDPSSSSSTCYCAQHSAHGHRNSTQHSYTCR